MSYINAFITVSEDCPVNSSEIPKAKRDKKPAHLIQYELLTEDPYTYTHEDLVYEVYIRHKEFPEEELKAHGKEIREKLLSKGHPCMRASALVKRYGYGAHYDGKGTIAIYPMESKEYKNFVKDGNLKKYPGMKTKR